MSGNVTELFKKPLSIANLEMLLEEAKKGNIETMVIIGVTKEDCVISGYSGADACPYTLMGALKHMGDIISDRFIER